MSASHNIFSFQEECGRDKFFSFFFPKELEKKMLLTEKIKKKALLKIFLFRHDSVPLSPMEIIFLFFFLSISYTVWTQIIIDRVTLIFGGADFIFFSELIAFSCRLKLKKMERLAIKWKRFIATSRPQAIKQFLRH